MVNRVLKNPQSVDPQDNRRKARRRPILESFSVFVVAGKKDVCKLKIHDLSELGIGFYFDVGGESATEIPVKAGDAMNLELYLNQTLHIPLQIKVMRVEEVEGSRKLGAEYADKSSKGYLALIAFLEMLDRVMDAASIDKIS